MAQVAGDTDFIAKEDEPESQIVNTPTDSDEDEFDLKENSDYKEKEKLNTKLNSPKPPKSIIEPPGNTSFPETTTKNPMSITALSALSATITPLQCSELKPLMYWTFSHAGWWYVVVLENQPHMAFSLKVLTNGVQVHWSVVTPTTTFMKDLGFTETDLNYYIKNLSGQFLIPSPSPIEHHTRLVEKIKSDVARIIQIFVVLTENCF